MGDYESRKHRRDDRRGRSNSSENSSENKSSSKESSSRGGKEDGYEKQLDDYQKYRETSPTPYDGSNKEKTQRPREHAPNNTIILTNLPANVDENWILYSLAELQVQNIKELRLIRDRRTGLPKGFCFVEFFSIYDSQAFYNNFYPSIPIGQQKVYLNYSEPQSGPSGSGMNSEDPNDLNWTCYTCGFFNIRRRFDCYKCNSRKPLALNAHVLYSEANKGLSDVGSIPLHVLLIRQLDKDVSADDLYKRFSQLGAIRRTWVIRDRESTESWGFGFIEFWDVNTAGSILAKISNPAQLPEDFVLIPNHPPILPSFAQMTSFVMAEAPSEWTVPGDQNTNLMYWDVRGYADQHPKELPLTYTEQEAESEEAVVVNNPAIPAASATPDTAAISSVISEQPTENVHAQLAALYDKISKMDTHLVENIPKPSILNQPIKEQIQSTTAAKKPVQSTTRSGNSKVQAQLNKWNQKQAELRQEEPTEPVEEVPAVPVSGANAIPSNPYLKDLLDSEKKACLLCKRQFKTEDELLRHRDVSDLHKQNLNDAELVKKIQEKIKAKFGPHVFNGLNEDGQYRDRAQERRILYNQPKNPPKSSNHFIQKKPAHNSEPVVEQVAQPPPPPSESIGSKLLKNMGWKEGQGLGRNMDGIVEPVKAESYGQGAGIGSGPKSNHEDAEKNLEYRDRVKNAFRQRFFEEQE